MSTHFESICCQLFKPKKKPGPIPIFDAVEQLKSETNTPATQARQLNAAFMKMLAGKQHPAFEKALKKTIRLLQNFSKRPRILWANVRLLGKTGDGGHRPKFE